MKNQPLDDANPAIWGANPTVTLSNPTAGDANPTVTLTNPTAGGANPAVTFPPPMIGFAAPMTGFTPPTVGFSPLFVKSWLFSAKTPVPAPQQRQTGGGASIPASQSCDSKVGSHLRGDRTARRAVPSKNASASLRFSSGHPAATDLSSKP